MKRNLLQLADQEFDLVVIGGGINGLCAAWDAALRGLKVALVEKGDFGCAASSGSFRIVHGGLRYLQHLNFCRMRRSIRERRWFMRAAPHLIERVTFLVPCIGHGLKGPEAMRAALLVNDTISFDRNRGLDPSRNIERGSMLSRADTISALGGWSPEGLTGGAVFQDGQMQSSERLTLSIAWAAEEAGAVLANYVEVVGALRDGDNRIAGVKVSDCVGGDTLDIRAATVLNMTGSWTMNLLNRLGASGSTEPFALCKGVQVITDKPVLQDHAIAVEGRQRGHRTIVSRGRRQLFLQPWRGTTFIGTTDEPFHDDPDAFSITQDDVAVFLEEVNRAYPPAQLSLPDIIGWNGGLRPADPVAAEAASASDTDRIIVHHARDGLEGVITGIGIKYTTARHHAERVIDAVAESKSLACRPCQTANSDLPGSDFSTFDGFVSEQMERPIVNEQVTSHLATSYGSGIGRIREYIMEDPLNATFVGTSDTVLRAEVVHAVREEMGVTCEDVFFRRTDLGAKGHPGSPTVEACARIMADELGWDDDKLNREIEAVENSMVLERSG